jgi:hypothetical protein
MGIEGSSEKPTRGSRLNFLMELTELPLNGSVPTNPFVSENRGGRVSNSVDPAAGQQILE